MMFLVKLAPRAYGVSMHRFFLQTVSFFLFISCHDFLSAENHLADEKSPYLILHKSNPVDWYPWGEAAFAKARAENKPILLSIGYSTCHWCHVMERESFEDKEVADYLNKHFVSIKLDREERPDVDNVYMTSYQAMYQGGGGWPLNMFLTPELKAFSGGTYFPPEARRGRPSFMQVLQTMEKAWRENGADVVKSANNMHQKMSAALEGVEVKPSELTVSDLDKSMNGFIESADTVNGSWGGAPKFPQVSNLRFLLSQWGRTGNVAARDHVIFTCDQMMQGGIHDHLAGGFHRYSVDEQWLVPHFEKMLYDQAQLLDLYLDVWQVTGEQKYRNVAVGIADFVLREMQQKQGGFYSAQDAQSEGKEGKCFCWTLAELKELLTAEELALVTRWFGVTAEGNFLDHSDPLPLPDQNVLHIAESSWKPSEKEKGVLNAGISKMKTTRSKRVPAATDDKILADWNGMMISSLARAGRVLAEDKYLTAAVRAHAFVKEKLWDSKAETLSHRWRDGGVDTSQQASSYLQMMAGSISLYEATLRPEYLSFAIQLSAGAKALFYDEENGGFFVGANRPDLVLRLKDDFDGAVPTASSVGAIQFLKLAEITGREDFRKVAEKTLAAYSKTIKQSPQAMAWMAYMANHQLGSHARLVVTAGDGRDALLSSGYHYYKPTLIRMGNQGPVAEFTLGLKPIEGKSTAYFCEGETCQSPVSSAEELKVILK